MTRSAFFTILPSFFEVHQNTHALLMKDSGQRKQPILTS